MMIANLANPDEVRLVTSTLLEAFDQLIASRGENEIANFDVLMGFHNAYKYMIVELERQTGLPFRTFAQDTLEQALPRGTTGYVWDTQILGDVGGTDAKSDEERF